MNFQRHRMMMIKKNKKFNLSADVANQKRGGRNLNDLLRQQSENSFSGSKNRGILKFSVVFLDFLIF